MGKNMIWMIRAHYFQFTPPPPVQSVYSRMSATFVLQTKCIQKVFRAFDFFTFPFQRFRSCSHSVFYCLWCCFCREHFIRSPRMQRFHQNKNHHNNTLQGTHRCILGSVPANTAAIGLLNSEQATAFFPDRRMIMGAARPLSIADTALCN